MQREVWVGRAEGSNGGIMGTTAIEEQLQKKKCRDIAKSIKSFQQRLHTM